MEGNEEETEALIEAERGIQKVREKPVPRGAVARRAHLRRLQHDLDRAGTAALHQRRRGAVPPGADYARSFAR